MKFRLLLLLFMLLSGSVCAELDIEAGDFFSVVDVRQVDQDYYYDWQDQPYHTNLLSRGFEAFETRYVGEDYIIVENPYDSMRWDLDPAGFAQNIFNFTVNFPNSTEDIFIFKEPNRIHFQLIEYDLESINNGIISFLGNLRENVTRALALMPEWTIMEKDSIEQAIAAITPQTNTWSFAFNMSGVHGIDEWYSFTGKIYHPETYFLKVVIHLEENGCIQLYRFFEYSWQSESWWKHYRLSEQINTEQGIAQQFEQEETVSGDKPSVDPWLLGIVLVELLIIVYLLFRIKKSRN